MMGEYVVSDQDVTLKSKTGNVRNTAWEVTGSWLLTGEDATYGTVVPKHSFDPREGYWGAFQLVGRVRGVERGQRRVLGWF